MLLYLSPFPGATAQQIIPAAQPCETQSPQWSHAMPMHGGAAPFAPQHMVPAGAPAGGHVVGAGGGGCVGGGWGTLASSAMGMATSLVLASAVGSLPGAAPAPGVAALGSVT